MRKENLEPLQSEKKLFTMKKGNDHPGMYTLLQAWVMEVEVGDQGGTGPLSSFNWGGGGGTRGHTALIIPYDSVRYTHFLKSMSQKFLNNVMLLHIH